MTAGDDADEARWVEPSELDILALTDNVAGTCATQDSFRRCRRRIREVERNPG